MSHKKNPFIYIIMCMLSFFVVTLPYSHLACSGGQKKDETAGKEKMAEGCEKAPPGMACVPGGYAVIGASEDDPFAMPGEKPRRKIYVDTFYIDKYEITNKDYRKCVKAGACPRVNTSSPLFRKSIAPKQPAVPLSWTRANAYCKWAGKRLPTEAEWEKAARGGMKGALYPWGDDPPDCTKASYRPCTKNTKKVGSYPPGHYGIYDMAGNGYEWTNDWASFCREGCGDESCGEDCTGDNPRGPCSGRYPCGKRYRKVMKGGSWWWPQEHLRGSWRRMQKIHSGGHRLSARCVSDTPYLTKAHAWMVRNPVPDRPDPSPPTAEQLKIHKNIETDALTKTICSRKWTSPAHCKDPVSYVVTNEARIYYFAKYLKNLGGGYAGVAADANYTFIAHARSRWVWLFDFDRNINALHRIIRVAVLHSENPKLFVERFHYKRVMSTMAMLRAHYGERKDFDLIKYVFFKYRSQLYGDYKRSLKKKKHFGKFGWLRNPKAYRYIRLLYRQDRIAIVPGDMLKDKTIRSIGRAAKKLGVPIRVYYPSNAEEFWKFTDTYKKNILSLPFDEASIVIRTVHEYPWHKRMYGMYRFWHYNIHGALNYQRYLKMKGYSKINHFKYERVFPYRKRDTLSTIHLPSSLPKDVRETLYPVKKKEGKKE